MKITHRSEKRGFTLMELMVVISIFVIISSIILADYPGFSQRVALERTAQEIALSMREAETRALAVRETVEGSGLFPGFGVHFNSATPQEYILFADINSDNVFQTPEEIDHFFIEKSPEIVAVCVNVETNPPGDCTMSWVDIVYLRPDPTITITTNLGTRTNFTLFIETPDGMQKQVIAWITGQIEIR